LHSCDNRTAFAQDKKNRHGAGFERIDLRSLPVSEPVFYI
jgi:hypothetical protein